MQIRDAVVFITGANRGLGLAYAQAALGAGARKVYAAAREPDAITLAGVTPIRLDVTRPADALAAVQACGDVTLLINNAGISRGAPFLAADSIAGIRAEFETNFFGPLMLSRAFAPVLAANGGGAIINVLSVLSWINLPLSSGYCASKAAAWSLTNGLRNELRAQQTQVVGVHVGFMDTDLTRGLDVAKADPRAVAEQSFAVLAAGGEEVLADALSRQVKLGLSAEPGIYLGAAG